MSLLKIVVTLWQKVNMILFPVTNTEFQFDITSSIADWLKWPSSEHHIEIYQKPLKTIKPNLYDF